MTCSYTYQSIHFSNSSFSVSAVNIIVMTQFDAAQNKLFFYICHDLLSNSNYNNGCPITPTVLLLISCGTSTPLPYRATFLITYFTSTTFFCSPPSYWSSQNGTNITSWKNQYFSILERIVSEFYYPIVSGTRKQCG